MGSGTDLDINTTGALSGVKAFRRIVQPSYDCGTTPTQLPPIENVLALISRQVGEIAFLQEEVTQVQQNVAALQSTVGNFMCGGAKQIVIPSALNTRKRNKPSKGFLQGAAELPRATS